MNDTELDEELRERWRDDAEGADRVAAARAELERRLAEDDGGEVAQSHVGRARQRLSEACRCSGLLEESLEHKDAALEIWRAQDKARAAFLVELQRTIVLAELGRHDEASRAHADLGERLEGDERLEPYYRDFWLEYGARCACLAGDRAHAEAQLLEARSLRERTRAERIVQWTDHALGKLRRANDSV